MVRRNRTSLVASILMFILGVLTFLFVSRLLGVILIVLSIIMFGLYRWLMRWFARLSAEEH